MILSHPGTYVDWEYCYRKCSSRSDDKDRCRAVIDKMSKSCEDIPVDSYGKVVLCGNSGAGKSTLTKVSKRIYDLQTSTIYCVQSTIGINMMYIHLIKGYHQFVKTSWSSSIEGENECNYIYIYIYIWRPFHSGTHSSHNYLICLALQN